MECDSLQNQPMGHEQLPKLLGIGTKDRVMLGRIVLDLVVCLPDKGIVLLVDVGEGANFLRNV